MLGLLPNTYDALLHLFLAIAMTLRSTNIKIPPLWPNTETPSNKTKQKKFFRFFMT
jgi:hypothetical protein